MKKIKQAVKSVIDGQRMGARRSVIQELFNDMYHDRKRIYWMNFTRGIFFGLGSVIGATVVVAILVWIMSFFVDFPGIADAISTIKSD